MTYKNTKEIFNWNRLLNRILFGMPASKYALNNTNFKTLERASLLGARKIPIWKIATRMIPTRQITPEKFPPRKIPTQDNSHPDNSYQEKFHPG